MRQGQHGPGPGPGASALVRTPSEAAWGSKGATVYYKRAVINFCSSEGCVKLRDVKMPIAVNSPA